MSYSNPLYPVTYSFTVNHASGNVTKTIKAPPGVETGAIRFVHAAATVAFTAVTTPGAVQAGISGQLTKYLNMPLGTLAANASLSSTKAQIIQERINVADGDLLITFVAPTGGTPAGTADYEIHIDWF